MLTGDVVPRFAKLAATLVGVWFWLSPLSAQGAILITIDKATQQMTVDIDGTTRWIWPVSTGRRGYSTPAGSFRPFRLEEDHYSKEWDEAPMPHSIFFTGDGHCHSRQLRNAPTRPPRLARLRAARSEERQELVHAGQARRPCQCTGGGAGGFRRAGRGEEIYARLVSTDGAARAQGSSDPRPDCTVGSTS
jgi:hypothetical protein